MCGVFLGERAWFGMHDQCDGVAVAKCCPVKFFVGAVVVVATQDNE